MRELKPWIEKFGGCVVELGSRDGHDANEMRKLFRAKRTITIEANPYCYNQIINSYSAFENYNLAISNFDGEIDFWQVDESNGEVILGQSSTLYKPSYEQIAKKITVPALTMDSFLELANIDAIAAMKIDVEGATYEVLEGFSNIRKVRLFHIESEHVRFWEGQKLYDDTAQLLIAAGYEQVYFKPVWTEQSDSIWLRKDKK